MTTTSDRPFVGRDMLCFSHDWTGDPLSKTHLMRLLARQGNRILWVNSIGYRTPSVGSKRDLSRVVAKLQAAAQPVREVEPNLFVVSPLVIPAWGRAWAKAVNTRLLTWQVKSAMQRLRFRRPINWVFNPAAGVIAGRLGEDRLIYYCVDEYTHFAGVNTGSLGAIETDLLARADLVVVSAEPLMKTKRSQKAPTVLVRHGVDYEHFRTALLPETVVPAAVAALPKPVIGYFGLMSQDWVDVPLLIRIARQYPQGSLVLLGKQAMDLSPLRSEPNVFMPGRVEYATLPAYCKGFDVAIIPFPVSEVTRNANPLKAREYLAAGLPVVSTDLPEVRVFGADCRTAGDHDEFLRHLAAALADPGPSAARSRRMATESWAARLDQVRGHFAETEAAR